MGCGSSSIRHFHPYKINGAEILFNKYDRDKSGYIGRNEFAELIISMGYHLREDELDLDMVLMGHNGKISREVFSKWWKSDKRFAKLQWTEEQCVMVKKVQAKFKEYDKDGSGKVDIKEFKSMHADLLHGGITTKPLESAMIEMDKNKDGKIDNVEYLRFIVSAK